MGRVDLRNSYNVFQERGGHFVADENRRGQRYECQVASEAVSYMRHRTGGRRVSAEQTGTVLKPATERFGSPYTYGDKLRYSGQHVLVAAVALGQATVAKEGRSYLYSIK